MPRQALVEPRRAICSAPPPNPDTLWGMRSFNLCGWTSVIVPAFFVGFAVATFAGSDLIGWIAAVVVGAGIVAYQARSGRSAACALPPAPAPEDEPAATRR